MQVAMSVLKQLLRYQQAHRRHGDRIDENFVLFRFSLVPGFFGTESRIQIQLCLRNRQQTVWQ